MSDETTSATEVALAGLPSSVRERLAEFTRSLASTLGTNLVGVLLHGAVVRGEYRPGQSDVEVIVIVERAELAELEAIGQAAQQARYSARIETMILTAAEIGGASDVFPLLYDEIQRRHVVLTGRDAFAGVLVHDTYRRLRIEQELREAQIHLRRAVIDAFGAPEAIGGAVHRKVKQVRAPLHALLVLKGITGAPDLAAVVAKAGETYGVDVAPLRDARESPQAAHAALVLLLGRAIDDANALEAPAARGPGGSSG